MTGPALTGSRHLRLIRDDTPPAGQTALGCAAAVARSLRGRGFAATIGSAGTNGLAGILVITPAGARLAEQFDVTACDGTPWLWRAGEPVCPADDAGTAAGVIARLLAGPCCGQLPAIPGREDQP